MEARWVAQRAALRCLTKEPPQWTRPQLAAAIGSSVSFVKTWLKRIRSADPEDLQVLFSRSRAPHTPPPSPDGRVVPRILEIRTSPPENLQRTPGPRVWITNIVTLRRPAHRGPKERQEPPCDICVLARSVTAPGLGPDGAYESETAHRKASGPPVLAEATI
jgi:hypothetical protein